jgi:hypothetical protein
MIHKQKEGNTTNVEKISSDISLQRGRIDILNQRSRLSGFVRATASSCARHDAGA